MLRLSFSGPSLAFANSVPMQAFPLKICEKLDSCKSKWCGLFQSKVLKPYCAVWFEVEAIFEGIYGVLAYSQGTSGLTTCGNSVI